MRGVVGSYFGGGELRMWRRRGRRKLSDRRSSRSRSPYERSVGGNCLIFITCRPPFDWRGDDGHLNDTITTL